MSERQTLFDGRLVCRQHENGYRFSIDAVLIAHFVQHRANERLLDLGCGCGVIGLILCYRHPVLKVTGVELQPALVRLAIGNAEENGYENRLTIQQGDLRRIGEVVQPESFDGVITNPPYRCPGRGRINTRDESAIARHELTADMDTVLAAASFAVKNRGKVACIYPADRLATLIATMERHRLTAKRLQAVYSYPADDHARLVMVEAVKNGGEGLRILSPLFIYTHPCGPYSPQVRAFYKP